MIIENNVNPEIFRAIGPTVIGGFAPRSFTEANRYNEIMELLIVDTGAGQSFVDYDYALESGLAERKEKSVNTVQGPVFIKFFNAVLWLPGRFSDGSYFLFRGPADFGGVRGVNESFASSFKKKFPNKEISIIGGLGRDFLQFCQLEINFCEGKTKVLLTEEILKAKA